MNEANKILLLSFLRRARAALDASSWQPGSIGILDWYTDNASESNLQRRAEQPALADLADEWDIKFRADLYGFLGADADGKVPFYFRTFAHLENENWQLEGTPLAVLPSFPIFGLYLIREGDSSRYGDFLENVFCYPAEPENAPKDQYGQTPLEAFFNGNQGGEMCSTGDGWEGMDWTDPDKMDADPRYSGRHEFAADIGDLVLADLDEADLRDSVLRGFDSARGAMLDKLADQATEGAREWFGGNAVHPKALLAA